MHLMTVRFLLLLISILTVGAANPRQMNRTARALRSVAIRDPSNPLPIDWQRIIADFWYYDWKWLLDVFPKTMENHQFRLYVGECIRSGKLVTANESEWTQWSWDPIEVDDNGNIIEIVLPNRNLTDCSIGDLSKLPSTLKQLNLNENNLTRLNVAALPRGLEAIYLCHNQLTMLDVTKLPPDLTDLWLEDNNLTMIDFSALPIRLDYIDLDNNHLTSANLSQVPINLKSIDLSRNYLDEADFGTLPIDSRCTSVYGQDTQKTKGAE